MPLLEGNTLNANICFLPERTLVIISPNDGATIDLEEYNNQFKVAHELTMGIKVGVLVRTSPFLNITKEVREESLNPEKEKYIIAQAILVKNFANKLVGNFYIKFQKPKVPNKLFSSEAEALKWLEKMIEAHKKAKVNSKNIAA